jgi:hypothetical protein
MVVFLLWPEEADMPPPGGRPQKSLAFKEVRPYPGELTVGGVRFYPGMTTEEYSNGTIEFMKAVVSVWQFWRGPVFVGLTSKGKRLPTGGRSRRIRCFVDVCVGFSNPE